MATHTLPFFCDKFLYILSASITGILFSINILDTVDLPVAIPPVRPTTFIHSPISYHTSYLLYLYLQLKAQLAALRFPFYLSPNLQWYLAQVYMYLLSIRHELVV